MFTSIFRKLLRIALNNVEVSVERGFWLVFDLVKKHKLFLFLLLILGVFIGFIQGAAIGLIAFSVFIITGKTDTCPDVLIKIESYAPIDLCANFDKYDMFVQIVLLSIFIQILKAIVIYTSSYLAVILRTKVIFDIKSRAMAHMLKLHYEELNRMSSGEKQTIISQSNVLANLMTIANQTVIALSVITFYFLLLIMMDWKLSLLSFGLVLTMFLIISPLIKKIKDMAVKERKNRILMQSKIIDYLFAIRIIKLYGKNNQVLDSIKKLINLEKSIIRKIHGYKLAIQPIQETAVIFCVALMLLFGFYFSNESVEQVLPSILAYVMVLNRCSTEVIGLNNIRAGIARAMAPLTHISDFLRKDNKIIIDSNGKSISDKWSGIEIDNVSFNYSKSNEMVLENINLKIDKGAKIAFVGPSGSGKSTLVDIIVGLLDPVSGTVRLGEINVQEAKKDEWMNQFSMVSQNDIILSGTVKENLAFAKENATNKQIIEACKIADAHDFIMNMENGYDSILGERGYKVSGGQIQRIAFARAILKNSPVLILDEATSALDMLTEKRIIEALEMAGNNNKTVISIAHRISTIINSDCIYVVNNGTIIESGTHAQLLKQAGLYKRIWEAQSYD